MLQATVVRGWRTPQIERAYDLAVEFDGQYYDPTRRPSKQRDQRSAQYKRYHQNNLERVKELKRKTAHSELGAHNQSAVLRAIKRYINNEVTPSNAREMTAEAFDNVRAHLVKMGKLAPPTADSLDGKKYVELLSSRHMNPTSFQIVRKYTA